MSGRLRWAAALAGLAFALAPAAARGDDLTTYAVRGGDGKPLVGGSTTNAGAGGDWLAYLARPATGGGFEGVALPRFAGYEHERVSALAVDPSTGDIWV